jgi:hypothetical protein
VRSAGATPISEENEPPQRACHLSVRLPLNVYNALVALAAADERSIAGEVRWLIRQKAEESGLLWEES